MINNASLRRLRKQGAFDYNELPIKRQINHISPWWAWIVMVAIWFVMTMIILLECAQAATLNQWADAIRITEGNPNYGILSVKCHNEAQCRQICKNTVKRTWGRFCKENLKQTQKTPQTMAFVQYLSNRYCPPSVDPTGNRNWRKNMLVLLRRSKLK